MRNRWYDIGTIAGAIVVPVVAAMGLMIFQHKAASEASRDSAEVFHLIAMSAWWVVLLGWAIYRLVVGMRRKWRGTVFRAVGLVIVLLAFPSGCGGFIAPMLADGFTRSGQIHRVREELDHQAIAAACASVMSRPEFYAKRKWDDPEFPAVLRDVRPSYIDVQERSIRMEMHGGFDHYGFEFHPDHEAGAANSWGLWFYTESSDTPLVRGIKVETTASPAGKSADQ